jgi:hypothetical protein
VRLQHSLPLEVAHEFALGRQTLAAGEAADGARRFVAGTGRHGDLEPA